MPSISRIARALGRHFKPLSDRWVMWRAHKHRARLTATTFLGVTGSAGKTIAKDLASVILEEAGPTAATPRSMNHLLDVAQLILAVKRSDRFAVVEIAVSGPGTLDAKLALTRPRIGALTLVQRDHIKNFDSIEAIAQEKRKLIDALPHDGVAVLNIDDPRVRAIGEATRAERLWFGVSPEADLRLVRATSTYPDPLVLELSFQGRSHHCVTSMHGMHLAVPVLAAIGMGVAAGVPIDRCIKALAKVQTIAGRMQIVSDAHGVTFVRDDFKAPYWSFQAALDFLADARAGRKVAVVGTLSDYALSASKLYPKVARRVTAAADLAVFVGPHALRALKARRHEDDRSIVGFTDLEDAHRFLQTELRAGDLVLLKGSNRADHLVRLLLARSRPVGCWSSGCGFGRFCDACPRLDRPRPSRAGVAMDEASGPVAALPSQDIAPSDPERAWLVVGLGNHGDTYEATPHNMGFVAVDRLAERLGASWTADAAGHLAKGRLDGREVVLLKPGTPLNLCGPVVLGVLGSLQVHPRRLLLVHDDADLPLGQVKVKREGSDGGHKGLRSIFAALGNGGFVVRVRVGVRRSPGDRRAAGAMVLQPFGPADEAGVAKAIEATTASIAGLLAEQPGGARPSADPARAETA